MTDNRRELDHTRALKIAYLIQQFPVPTETFAVSDIAALLEQGHDVTVFTMKRPPRRERALLRRCAVPANLPINRPSFLGALLWPVLLWRHWRAAFHLVGRILASARSSPKVSAQALLCVPRLVEIADRLDRNNAEVAHAFWSRHVGLVLPVLKAEEAPILRSAFLGAYDLVADDFLVDMTMDAAEIVFSHSEANRPHLDRKASPAAVRLIVPRGIPLFPIEDEIERDHFRCATASALVASKNVEAVIRACAQARKREPSLTLDIFGDGPERARLEQLGRDLDPSDWLNFAGHVSRERLFEELRRTQLFLLLSNKPSERSPNVVKEALWAGCYVISSRSEGIEELIPNQGIGEVVDPDDRPHLENLLATALQESDEAATERRRKARAHVSEYFSSERNMRRYADAWREAIDRRLSRFPSQVSQSATNRRFSAPPLRPSSPPR